MSKKIILLGSLIFFSVLFQIANNAVSKPLDDSNKGLFIIQLSWNPYTYSKDVSITINYYKNTTLNKVRDSKETIKGIKNQFLTAELNEGEYKILSIDLTGGNIPYGKRLNIKVDKTFVIEAGKVTNGGLLFLTSESSNSDQVMFLPIDNIPDVKRHLEIYHTPYSANINDMNGVLTFLEKEKIDKVIRNYADILVKAENTKTRPNIKYLYATLGILIKMDRDEKGKVVHYDLVPTRTYQEITGVYFKGDKLLCTLGNGEYLFGDDTAMDPILLPTGTQGPGPVYWVGTNQFLMTDNKLNIFTADETFSWKTHREFSRDDALPFTPGVHLGPKNIYIYYTAFGKDKILLRSAYGDIVFHEVELPDEIKVNRVTETENKIIIGPKTRGLVKKPALLYVTNHSFDQWQVVELPRGDCNGFALDKNDENHYYTECSWDKIRYQSFDGGKTWEKLN